MNIPLTTPWIETPFFERLLAESAYDEAAKARIRSYVEDGFLIFDPEIPDFDTVAGEIIAQCSRRSEYGERLIDGWDTIEEIRDIACFPKILSLLEILYGKSPIPMQTINFGRGTEQRVHSDNIHFSSVPAGFMCGVWIALEDIDEDNGPLELYPGSHRLPAYDLSHLGISGSSQEGYERYSDYERFIETLIPELGLERRKLTLPKAHAIVWAANLLHGGSPIRDQARTRHSMVTHYYFEDCLYYQPMRSDPFLGKICWLDKRDVRTGQVIPQVYNGRRLQGRAYTLAKRMEMAARRSWAERLIRRLGLAGSLKRILQWIR